MRRLFVNTLSAAAVMFATAAMPMTSQAAVSTYQFSGGNAYVIGLGGQDCLPGSGNQNGNWNLNQNGSWNLGGIWNQNGNCDLNGGWNQNGNCDLNGGWGSGPILPEITPPDFNFPTPELPGPDQPGDMLPDQPGDPIPDQPGDMLPDQPGNPSPDDQNPSKPDQGEQEDGQDAYADAVVELVNAERAKAGLSPLSVNSDVAEAAQIRAQEIKGTFSHTRPDGSSFSTVLSQTGVSYRGVGENIAYGQNTPEAVMQGWMNSSGHRANILNKDFTSIGVGHYEDASGTDYWTQIFIY